MALVLDRSVVHSAEPVYANVELSGQLTRGQMVVDWDGLLGQPCNALVVKELDIGKIQALFMLMVRPQNFSPLTLQQNQLGQFSSSLPWTTADGQCVPQACIDTTILFDTN
ncbi:hypothetical protein EGW08_019219, partial [Elysia chlorotica]